MSTDKYIDRVMIGGVAAVPSGYRLPMSNKEFKIKELMQLKKNEVIEEGKEVIE